MIQLKKVTKRFGEQLVLDAVNLEVPKGKITVIVGGSGQGKSVTLKHMIGLMRPDSGEVWVDGQEISHLPESQLGKVRRLFGMLFQDAALFDSMSVFDNVAFPLVEHTDDSDERIRERVLRALDMVGLEQVEEKWPSQLSGGMRKRVGLARAIVGEPKIILYDEPTTGLDPIMTAQITKLIGDTQKMLGVTAVVISHDMGSTREIADRVVMLHQGKIIEQGDTKRFFASPNPWVQQFIEGRLEPS